MVQELMSEYLSHAQAAETVDYSDTTSVQKFNASSDRMRQIVDEIVNLGNDAVLAFVSLLDTNPAAIWAAHHLVEKANIDCETLARCFARVEEAKVDAEAKGDLAGAMGEEMWLEEWRAKKAEAQQ